MLRTTYQVLGTIFILLFMLIIPAFVMYTFGSENIKTIPDVSAQSVQTGQVLGTDSRRIERTITDTFQNIYSIVYTALVILFGVAILSFLKYKLIK